MAWSRVSRFGVVAHISVQNLVGITKPVQAGRAAGGSGSLYARRYWILRHSSGGPATSASVVDLRSSLAAFWGVSDQGSVVIPVLADTRGFAFQRGRIRQKTIFRHWLMPDNGIVVVQPCDDGSDLNWSSTDNASPN